MRKVFIFASIFSLLIYGIFSAPEKYAYIQWEPVKDVEGYKIQLRKKGSETILQEEECSKPYYSVKSMKKGFYEFRLAPLTLLGKPIVWSNWNQLEIRVSKQPGLERAENVKIKKGNNSDTLSIKGENLSKASKLDFQSKDHSFRPSKVNVKSSKEIDIVINTENIQPGVYDLNVKNPYNKSIKKKGFLTIEEKQDTVVLNEKRIAKKENQSKQLSEYEEEVNKKKESNTPEPIKNNNPQSSDRKEEIVKPFEKKKEPKKETLAVVEKKEEPKKETEPVKSVTVVTQKKKEPELEPKKDIVKPTEPIQKKEPVPVAKERPVKKKKAEGIREVERNPSTDPVIDYSRYNGSGLEAYLSMIKKLGSNCGSGALPDYLLSRCAKNHVLLNLNNLERRNMYNFLRLRSSNYFTRQEAYNYFSSNCKHRMRATAEYLQESKKEKNLIPWRKI